jgi:hypothetical protein
VRPKCRGYFVHSSDCGLGLPLWHSSTRPSIQSKLLALPCLYLQVLLKSCRDHWYEDKGMVPGKSQRQVKCRFCPFIMLYRGNRMLAYLGYRPPLGGACDVSTCRMVPPHIRVLFEDCKGVVPLQVGIENEDPPMRDDVSLEPIIADSVDSKTKPLFMSQSTQHSDVVAHDTPPRELRQLNITEGFNVST